MRAVEPPAELRRRYDRWAWSPAWAYGTAVTAWRLSSSSGEVRFLKVRAAGEYPSLADEAMRLRWAVDHVRVPAVLAVGSDGGVDWLLLEGPRPSNRSRAG